MQRCFSCICKTLCVYLFSPNMNSVAHCPLMSSIALARVTYAHTTQTVLNTKKQTETKRDDIHWNQICILHQKNSSMITVCNTEIHTTEFREKREEEKKGKGGKEREGQRRKFQHLSWSPYVIGGPLYFCPVVSFYLLLLLLLFFPRLISAATHWMSTILLHMAWP